MGTISSHWPTRFCAESPPRRARQLTGDVVAVLLLLGCLWIGNGVHDLTNQLAGPGRSLEAAGSSLGDRLAEAGSAAKEVPVVGEELATPFTGASDAGRTLEGAGVQQQAAVGTLANALGWLSGGVPALLVLALWLPRRLRFARQAAPARRLLDAGVSLDVFALRALARQPVAALERLEGDVAAGWRAGDPAVVEALAGLELRELGLDVGRSSAYTSPGCTCTVTSSSAVTSP